MVSYILGGISSFLLGEEDDDPQCLKDVALIAVYESPHKQLGVSLNAAPWEVRDALRTNCLCLLGTTYFNKLDKPLLPYKYSLIAFHLIMKTLSVTKAQHLKAFMEKNPTAFDGRARDMLQILRPVHCEGIPMNAAVRACAMLQVLYVETIKYSPPEGERDYVMPHQKYVLRVVYCGRSHFVRKRYMDFYDLNESMADELLMVPGFPPKSFWFKVGFVDYAERGRTLCAYVNRVHASLAARGVFSPRLMDFLGVDAARVHIEEDGRVSKWLDTAGALQGSAWHMVEETWLKRWRKFVLGRGARRYEPPGPITNELLLIPRDHILLEDDDERATTVPRPKRRIPRQVAPSHREIKALGNKENRHIYLPELPPSEQPAAATDAAPPPPPPPRQKGPASSVFSAVASKGADALQQPEAKETLALVRHYRAINYNLWVYWKMVHGGGPCISRKSKDITSAPTCGTGMEAVSRLQRFGRMVLAKQERLDLYWKHLSRTAPGVREVLALWEERKLRERAEATIKASKTERTKSRLQLAARYTQRTWRAKKQYAFNDDNVRVQKHAQEIFAMADGEVERAAPGAPFVVEEGESIVKLGGVERFDVKFTDLDGPTLPMTLKKHSCSELTFVQTVAPPENNDRRKSKQLENLVPDCILLLVNNYPVSSLTHKQVMDRITSAKWPLTLRFERPLEVRDVRSFSKVIEDERNGKFGRDDEDFKLQLLKRLLHMGIPLRKYGRKGAPHDTVLYLGETLVFWEQKTAVKLHKETPTLSKKYDLTRGLPLYDLKYVRIDKVSSVFRGASARKARPNCCFTLFAETRTLDFEVVTVGDHDDANTAADGRRLLAWAFDSIIKEARGSKIFVDKTGAPIRRTAPKKRLRMVR